MRKGKGLFAVMTAWIMIGSLMTGCSGGGKSDDGMSGSVSINGSSSMEKVIGTLAERFMTDHSGVSVIYDPAGSGAGIEAVINGPADIGLASRALKDIETGRGAIGITVALDGIAVIVHAENSVNDLTVEQIAGIYTGSITDWSQLGGTAGAISRVGREAGSGTRDGFEAATATVDSCKLSQEMTSTGAVIEAVAADPGAIGYVSLSAVEDRDTVRTVSVNGVACREESVLDGSYAIQRPFILVTREDAVLSEQAQAFFDFALSADAAGSIRAAGAVPVAG